MLVNGPAPAHEPWDALWRAHLVDNLGVLVQELWTVGMTEIFIDGSFVEDKAHPNDIDGYFACDLMSLASGELQRQLNVINPHKIWTWEPQSRRPSRGYSKPQLPMWHVYRVELYPHWGRPFNIWLFFVHCCLIENKMQLAGGDKDVVGQRICPFRPGAAHLCHGPWRVRAPPGRRSD
jgi:hypothetical protein